MRLRIILNPKRELVVSVILKTDMGGGGRVAGEKDMYVCEGLYKIYLCFIHFFK